MKLDVNISDSTITKCTESVTHCDMAIDASTKFPSTILTERVCRGFVNKALEFILNYTKPVGNVQEVRVGSEIIKYVTLKNVKETAHFFDTFKRLGINIGTLTVGYDSDFKHLYVPGKLVKDLKRHEGSETLSAITMYMLTLAVFCATIYTRREKYNVDTYSRTVAIDDCISDYFYSFADTEYHITIEDIKTEDFERIHWDFGAYSAYEYPFAPGVIACDYNIVNIDGEETTIVMQFKIGSGVYFFQIFENGTILTNQELSYFELQADSMTRAIMPRKGPCAMILHTERPKGTSWEIIDMDTAPSWAQAALADIMSRIECTEGITKSAYTSTYGISIKGSSGGVDAESMKAQYEDDAYAQQLYSKVKPYYDTFDLGNLANLAAGVAKGDIFSMMFTGSSGTGKSTAAKVLFHKCGLPYVVINFSVNIEEADLFGTMIPNPEKKDASDPEFIWQDGAITDAMRHGYGVIAEEINFARPSVLGKFNAILDESRQIDLPTKEIVSAHPNFRLIATCNIAYEGTNRMNKAFINRFEQVVIFEDLPTSKLSEAIKMHTGYTNDANIAKVIDVYLAIKKFSEEQNLDLVVSVRQLISLFKQGKYYKSAKEAVENIIVNGAFIENPEYASLFKKTILTAFDLKFKI